MATNNRRGQGAAMQFVQQALASETDECIMWPFCTNPVNGYCHFGFEGEAYVAHRFICRQTHGPKPSDDHVAAHSCHKRSCINPRHISWKTKSENMLDRRENGTVNIAWWGRKGKLTVEQAADVLALKDITTQAAIAEMYRITESNVRKIHSGMIWARRIERMKRAA